MLSDRFLALAIAAAIVSLAPAAGQTRAAKKTAAKKPWTPPLTADGQPDFQGVWLSNSATPLERPKALEGKQFLTEAEVADLQKRADKLFRDGNSDYAAGDNAFLAAYGNVDQYKNPNISVGSSIEMVEREFDNRTSLIVDPPDGKLPPLTPEGKLRVSAAEAKARFPASTEDISGPLRCITFGVPRLGGNFGAGPYSYYQIFQSPGYVVLYPEIIHDPRIIPLDGRPHLPQNIRQWNGDSRGKWEGKTLVVDTTNFSPQSYYMGATENLHLTERFTRVAAGTIKYEITIDDPTTWTKPWTAVIYLKQSPDKIYEFACHEGNYDVMVSMLAGTRAEEKAAEAKTDSTK